MSVLFTIVSITAAGAITPGPNNAIVLALARKGGWPAAMRAIIEIVLASVILLVVARALLSWAGKLHPYLVLGATIIGSLILAGLGLKFWRLAGEFSDDAPLIIHTGQLALFQIVNPKSWILVGVISAAATATNIAFIPFILLVCLTLTICLSIWAAFGQVIGLYLQSERLMVLFDRCVALILLVCAIALPVGILISGKA